MDQVLANFSGNQVQGNMAKAQRNRASKGQYVSTNQLVLMGFESPFTQHLNAANRWVKLGSSDTLGSYCNSLLSD